MTTTIRGECHAALISAPGSGQGKSMMTAADPLGRTHKLARQRGRAGLDYIVFNIQVAQVAHE
ncbi:hypothetical protein HOP52_19110 [Halomonas campisalis]|uniref:Uncharacterized protein n=1 Tax=Billgrantia campisalis TaxID=74661 RepID=A0ABS9PF25_9GAMM|nr:hypothetical protein [Halomonas campisalis]MCG6659857.1 hypothetical protein [Halomonas campisalis]MDR5865039.1 hypothetical protein [Halomonas campisalis]